MTTLLLATKLHIPQRRSALVPRPRLCQRIDEALRLAPRLILICAPAGFGKTTLMSEWFETSQSNLPLAWLALDEDDNDLTRFFSYLIAALETIWPGVGADLTASLQSPQVPPAKVTLTALVNNLAEFTNQAILVLDDYHLIETQTIHEALAYFVDHLPPTLSLIILSRAEPPLPLARLRARGLLTELGVSDLRFTLDEAMSNEDSSKSRFGVGIVDRLLGGRSVWFSRRIVTRP